LVAEDCGYEIIDGRLVPVPPAHEPHGERHAKVLALLEAHVTADFNVACDMLTRTSETTNLAPDASVYPVARAPGTGRRQLEVLAFEVLASQSLSDTADRARHLARRGVRRIFAVDVSHHRVFEWSAPLDDWRVLADAAVIDDEAFAAPLPVAALVHAAKADDAMATALLAKRNRVLLDAHEHVRSEGLERGLESALFAVLRSRDIAWSDADRARIASADVPTLEIWIGRAATADTITDVFTG
jgi:Uma2 family endonuclease